MDLPKMSLEELKQIYPVESIKPHGIVLIIPARDWNPGNITGLTEANKTIYTEYNGKASVFIKLPTKETKQLEEATAPTVVFEPQKTPAAAPTPLTIAEPTHKKRNLTHWEQQEKDELTFLYDKEDNIKVITKRFQERFPDRTANAIHCAANDLHLTLRSKQKPKHHKLAATTTPTKSTKYKTPGKSNAEADNFIEESWKAGLTYDQINKSVKEHYPGKLICVDYRILLLKKAGRITGRHFGVKTTKGKLAEKQPIEKQKTEPPVAAEEEEAEKAKALFDILTTQYTIIHELKNTTEYLIYKIEATAMYASLPACLKHMNLRKEYVLAIHSDQETLKKFINKLIQLNDLT
jgi:hypothetical protein